MSFVSINNSKGGAPDGRVDRLVQDTTVTREDIGQVVAWLQELDEKVSAAQAVQDVPPLGECEDKWVRSRLDVVERTLQSYLERVDALVTDADDTCHNGNVRLLEQLKINHGLKEGIGCLQSIVKKLQEQPPQQTVQVYHNHTYTPESHRLMWWAIGFTFLIGALSYAV